MGENNPNFTPEENKGQSSFLFTYPQPSTENSWELLLSTVQQRTNHIYQFWESSQQLKSSAVEVSTLFETLNKSLVSTRSSKHKKALSKKEFLKYITDRNQDFKYKLSAIGFPKIICKKRFFNFNVILSELTEEILSENDEVPLIVEAWTAEPKPALINHNKEGENFIQGTNNCTLKYHSRRKKFIASVRIAVTEVTSHFMNGWIFILVREDVGRGSQKCIRPLVIKEVTVKAKKFQVKVEESD